MKHSFKVSLSLFAFVVGAAGCALDDASSDHAPLAIGDELDESMTDTPIELATDEEATELAIDDLVGSDQVDGDLQLEAPELTTTSDVVTLPYHLYTKVGATCRDHCVSSDQYLGSYMVGYSSPYYHYNNSSIYSTYWVGASKKQKWEQHRFSTAQVNVYCGSSGQFLYKYYGKAKKGRVVTRSWLCYAGRCTLQGDVYGSFYAGWNHR